MTKEEQYYNLVGAFQKKVCLKCLCWERSCENRDRHWFIACPQFFDYRIYGKAMTVQDFWEEGAKRRCAKEETEM